ncbi:MAG TPA: methyltransferase domain-containing protein [Thermoanaerobaculia bacterium]|jgi:23S rRNA (guanine745-N1)-methyltransferase|nr:methyltransferase domain-containing protein [Thermoanaerobaculia bacterium]
MLVCSVPACRAPLAIDSKTRRAVCPQGHSYDRAKSGYWNLLQPQDRRSNAPGDSKEAAQARRLLADRALDAPLFAALLPILDTLDPINHPPVLDVGCGEGAWLGFLGAHREVQPWGTDLSTAAIELAARRLPQATWVIANADRRLPFTDGSFDRITSLTARRNPEEFHRLLAPGGRLVIALPGPDDLIELREAVLGRGDRRERLDKALDELAPHFEVEGTERVDWTATLDEEGIAALLAATYRGGRAGRQERASRLAGTAVTFSRDLAWLKT